jgi:asparagine synthase (glutamine-hydrolysing)
MTAIGGLWSFDGRRDTPQLCRSILAGQARFCDGNVRVRQEGSLALGESGPADGPILLPDGYSILASDLRLDNREELGTALGLGDGDLRRLGDADIVGLALLKWGADAFERLLGDFALAWFDGTARRLLLARDPLGQRPLFWTRRRDFVAFASMPSGLHALADVERRPDVLAVARFLAHLPRSGPHSFFEGISRVEPGHVLLLAPDRTESHRYWQPSRRTLRIGHFDDYVDAFRAELDAAVSRRLRGAAAPVAAHLSGGWDSSAVTATAARLLQGRGESVDAFTSVPGEAAAACAPRSRFADEGPLAAATAASYPNIRHHLVPTAGGSPLARLDLEAPLFQRPLFNLCNHVWLAQIRTAAREAGADILLSGEIGNWTISAARAALLADFFREGRPLAGWRAAAALVRSGDARFRGAVAAALGPWLPKRLWAAAERLSSDPSWRLVPALRRPLLERVLRERASEPSERHLDRFDYAFTAFSGMDFGEHRKGIRAGWGVDKRDPTADIRLIEFCLSLPLDMLLDRSGRRPLARAALADRVPASVLDHRGKGYQASDWHVGLTADLERARALVEDIAADPLASSVIDPEPLRALLRSWPQGGWNDRLTISRYRNLFLQSLSAGHFLLWAQRPLPPTPPLPLEARP